MALDDFDIKKYIETFHKAIQEQDMDAVEYTSSHAIDMTQYFSELEKTGLDIIGEKFPLTANMSELLQLVMANSLADIMVTPNSDELTVARHMMAQQVFSRMMLSAFCIGIAMSVKEDWR